MRLRWMSGLVAAVALAFAHPAVAQTQRDQASFGSWKVQKDGASLEMYSANDTGSTVGVMCVDGQSCSVYVATRTRCENGRRYQGVVGADSGFADFDLTCRIVGDRFVYVLSDFARALRGLRQTSQWGLAFQSDGGGMQSIRFSISGTHEAIGAMALIDQGSTKATRNETMY